MTHTVESFLKLYEDDFNDGLTSILGTNIVENFFSIIRGKIRYCCLWEYAYVYSGAVAELKKRFCENPLFCYNVGACGRNKSKKYNDQIGVVFSVEACIMTFKGNKKHMDI